MPPWAALAQSPHFSRCITTHRQISDFLDSVALRHSDPVCHCATSFGLKDAWVADEVRTRRMTVIASMNSLASTNSGLGAANAAFRLGASSPKSFSEIYESQSTSSVPEAGTSATTEAAVSNTAATLLPAKGVNPKSASKTSTPNSLGQTISAALVPTVPVCIPDPVATEPSISLTTSTQPGLPDTRPSPNLPLNPIDTPGSADGKAKAATNPAPLPTSGSSVPPLAAEHAIASEQAIVSSLSLASGQIASYVPPQGMPSASADITPGQTLSGRRASPAPPASLEMPEDTAPTDVSADPPPQSGYAVSQRNDWIGQSTTAKATGGPIESVPSISPSISPSSNSNEAPAAAKSKPSDQEAASAPDPTQPETVGAGEAQNASSDAVSNDGKPQPTGSTGMNLPAQRSADVGPNLPVPAKSTSSSAGTPKRATAVSKPRFETTRSAKDGTGTETVSAEPAQDSTSTPADVHFQVDASVIPDPLRIAIVPPDGSGSPPPTSTKNSTIALRPPIPVDASATSSLTNANDNTVSSSTVGQNSTQQSQSKELADPKNLGAMPGSLDASPALTAVVVTASGNHDPKSVAASAPDSPTQKPPRNDSSASSDVGFDQAGGQPLPTTATASPIQLAQILTKATQAEMRIGLNTQAFGSVEVRTVVHASDVGVLIGSEKGDLRSLLTNDLPGIANTLQQQNLRLAQVSFQQQGFTASSDSSSGGNAQPRSFAARRDSTAAGLTEPRSEDSEPTAEAWSNRGLSVLA